MCHRLLLTGNLSAQLKKQAKKRFNRLLVKYEVELFDAEALWDKLPEVIERLGILGKPQYWKYENRIKVVE